MENLNNSMTVTLIKKQNWTKELTNQSILIFDNFLDFVKFNNANLLHIKYINPIRLIVYILYINERMISLLKTNLVTPPFYYFIIFDRNINLYTFENRKDLTFCHESQRLIKINEFSVTSLKWIKKPIFPKKYKNFHNCQMVIFNSDLSNLLRVNSGDEPTGPIIQLLETVAHQLNFKIFLMACFQRGCFERAQKSLYIYNVLYIPTLEGHSDRIDNNPRWNNVMLNIECV